MREDFLHYLWRLKKFDLSQLTTTQNKKIQILNFGIHNHDAGPDFSDALIQIGNTLWAGNVEMHLKSSDWKAHQHHKDAAYGNVILHVVYEEDQTIFRTSGEPIPCLELKHRIPSKLTKNYSRLAQNEHWIPCQNYLHKVNEITKYIFLDNVFVERLAEKTQIMATKLHENKGDWELSFYHFLAKSFGMKVNAIPFEQLAKQMPLNILTKHKGNLFQIEALLFGQAGLLTTVFNDSYPRKLQKEYNFLQKKYHLVPLNKSSWKFMRMRPANFPTIRIAQFAQLIWQSTSLFSKIIVAENIREIENVFQIKLSNYWLDHYRFDKASIRRKKTLGKSSIQHLIINTIIPFLFYYGQQKDKAVYKEKALQFLEVLAPEKNKPLKKWENLGFKAMSAYQSQALLQLKKNYCNQQKCMQCAIGNSILEG